MILIDTGPIVAMIDKKDYLHTRATQALKSLGRTSFLTTEACITETIFHLWDAQGWSGISILKSLIGNGVIEVSAREAGAVFAFQYMERFRDIPCDYADATLLVAAEQTGTRKIFTFDRHFHAYRLFNGDHLEVIP